MNYQRIYFELIEKRKRDIPEGYIEQHHINPFSISKSNDSDNLVYLTAREHFIAHLLLSKMYPEGSINWIKMQKALMKMFSISSNQLRYSPSRWYHYCREQVSIANSINQSGQGNSQYGKVWVHNNFLRKSTSVFKDELDILLENGWELGRVISWDKHFEKIHKKKIKQNKVNKSKPKENLKLKEREDNVKKYSEYYSIYNQYGWNKFKEITGYEKSKPNLVQQFKRYLPNFKPQNGKKRGNNA